MVYRLSMFYVVRNEAGYHCFEGSLYDVVCFYNKCALIKVALEVSIDGIVFHLSQNQLSVLPISIMSYLRKCTKLDLHQNNIKYVPASILELPLIKEYLSYNKIFELPNVLWSASLLRLNLSHNELKALPDCATKLCSDSMAVLWLEHNQLKEMPNCVLFLKQLKYS